MYLCPNCVQPWPLLYQGNSIGHICWVEDPIISVDGQLHQLSASIYSLLTWATHGSQKQATFRDKSKREKCEEARKYNTEKSHMEYDPLRISWPPAVGCTCVLLLLCSVAPVLCCTCTLLHLCSVAPVLCCTCVLLQLCSVAPVLCYICIATATPSKLGAEELFPFWVVICLLRKKAPLQKSEWAMHGISTLGIVSALLFTKRKRIRRGT